MSAEATARIDGRHVLAALLAFFAIMLIANSIFVYFAITTFGGIDTEDAYRKGLAYNATLAEAESQSGLGWRTALSYDETGRAIQVRIADSQDAPVVGLRLSGRLLHPASSRLDQAIDRFEERAGGLYVLPAEPSSRGAWIVELVAQSSTSAPFRMRHRLWLPPKS
ncbi:MAG: FixH family protein [Hyphomicrobiaceae bacterium]